jgi:hypothetical protein
MAAIIVFTPIYSLTDRLFVIYLDKIHFEKKKNKFFFLEIFTTVV